LYTLKNIIEIICTKLDFDPFFVIKNKIEYCVDKKTNKKLIVQSNEYVRKIDTPGIVGDSSKLFKVLNREFKKDINSVINEMIEMDIKRLKNLNDIQNKI
jgi:GDP-D-mannose dehydratase